MIICIESAEDVKDFFSFEISPYPLSLFDQYGMRKTTKSKLYEEFDAEDDLTTRNTDLFIIDGGFLFHKVSGTKNA